MARTQITPEALFWDLVDELCARVAGEFLGLVDYKGSGMVVKLPRERVDDLIAQGVGRPFAPAGRMFREWVAIPKTRPSSMVQTPTRCPSTS
jgi:hypothetical protein